MTLSIQPTYSKAQAAHEAGERVGGLRGVSLLCDSHTWPEGCEMSQQPQSSAGKELLLPCLVSNACNSQLVEEHQLFFFF